MSIRLALPVLVVALVAWLAIQFLCWGGWAGMNHATGAVAALAEAVTHGEAPGHARGDTFLATIYAPPFPVAVTILHDTGMSWHAALRWASLLSALGLLVATFAFTVATGASAAGALAAIALLAASFPFTAASLAGRADLASAAFSIAALAAWCADREQRGWLAAALAALAWLTKVSAVTMPLALVIAAIAQGQGVPAVRFLARFVVAAVVGLLLTLPVHGPGWYASVLGTLLFAPPNTSHLLRGPAELLRYLGSFAELAAAAAMALAYLTARESRRRPGRSYALAALLVALVVMTNRGSDHNHLLELTAVGAACAGAWCERFGARSGGLAGALVTLVVLAASWRNLHSYARDAGLADARRGAVLAAVRAESGPVFTEDALLSLAAGKRPAIADPAALRALERRGDRQARAVVQALADGRYGLVVLIGDLEQGAGKWYHDFHLGDAAVAALRGRYVKAGEADGYALYRPR